MADSPEKKSKLRVAVTGGSGRVGSCLIRALLKRGHEPFNIDVVAPAQKNCPYFAIDLRERDKVRKALKNCDAVCHLAEIPNIMDPLTEDGVFGHNTTVGSTVMCAAADFRIPRVVYTSSCQAYGSWGFHAIPPAQFPFDESHPVRPQNAYAQSKAANEGFAQLMALRHGLSIAAFRFPWVLTIEVETPDGPGWELLRKSTGECDGFGTYVHGSDAAMGYILALENPRPGFEAYHFVGQDVFSAIPIRQRLEKTYPNFPKLPANWGDYQSPVVTPKAKAHLGWEAKYFVREEYKKIFGDYPKA